MKRSNIWLSVAAVLAGTVSAWAGEPGRTPSYSASQKGVTSFVGDLPVEEEYSYHQDVVQTSCNECSDCSNSSSCGSSSSCDTCCDAMYDGGCDSMGGGGCFAGLLGGGGSGRKSNNTGWGRIETLFWWAEDRHSPALIATAPQGNNAAVRSSGPISLQPQGNTLFGETIESDLMVGNRLDFGTYLGSSKAIGIGARVYGLWNGSTSASAASADGSTSVGIPFFNIRNDGGLAFGADSFLAAFETNPAVGTPNLTGSASATSDFEFIGSEAYARALFGRGKNYQVDLIGGYSFHSVDDSIALSGSSTSAIDVFRFSESWAAENTFHGGQVGFESQVTSGRWMLTSLAKVHLGNMRQTVRVSGASSVTLLANNSVTNLADRGVLVQGNGGFFSQDSFTFTPEVNMKLGYSLSDCATFTVGYSFLMWSDLALAGNHIDDRIDNAAVGNNAAALNGSTPGFVWNTESFFLHGLDLGLTFQF